GAVTSFSYITTSTKAKLLSSIARPLGERYTFMYDSENRLEAVIDPLGRYTTLIWDNLQRTAVIDPLGNRTTYTYNGDGLIQTVTNALGETVELNYDGRGNLAGRYNALGEVTTTVYNSANQPIAVVN